MHRLIRLQIGQPPVLWRSLAQSGAVWRSLVRLRQGISTAAFGAPLADAAAGAGFADQAHFTRLCWRFQRISPAPLLANRADVGGSSGPEVWLARHGGANLYQRAVGGADVGEGLAPGH